MLDIVFSTEVKKGCLKDGFSIDYLGQAIEEKIDIQVGESLDDTIYLLIDYNGKPIVVEGRGQGETLYVDEVDFDTTIIFAYEGEEPNRIIKPDSKKTMDHLLSLAMMDKEEVLITSIEELPIYAGIYYRLKKTDIHTIGDIVKNSKEYYRENKILSSRHLEELKIWLFGLSLDFAGESSDAID